MRNLQFHYWILDESGEPRKVNFHEWHPWFEKSAKLRQVAQDRVALQIVATFFTGLHFGPPDCVPLLYETVVIGGFYAGEIHRTATRKAALEGHQHVVDRVRRAVEIPSSGT